MVTEQRKAMAKIELTCKNCGKKFQKDESRILQKKRTGQKNFFCSFGCSIQYAAKHTSRPFRNS